jgi:DNA-binding NarL/FixJ family response regulator
MRVLLVEDSELLAKHLLEQLSAIPRVESLGVARTEQQAVEQIAQLSPDFVILDLHLKQGTGFGVLQSLPPAGKRPVVAVLTNHNLPQYRDRAIALGARYYLDKSSEFERLPKIIEQLNAAAPDTQT